MVRRTLHVVEEPLKPTAKVVVSMHGPERPLLVGGGRATMLCGRCGAVIARRIDPSSVRGLVLQCPACCAPNADSE